MEASEGRYNPGPDFVEDAKAPLLDISSSDSTELWLIQWPINQLQPSDFHGKELSLKLHRDGQLGSFESSSGKSYELISFQAQEPDAAVFLSSGSESKVVGKISRRVCLVHYPEPEELEKPGFGAFNLSSQRSEGSFRKSMSRYSTTPSKHGSVSKAEGMSHNTLVSAQSAAKKSRGYSDNYKQKRDEAATAPSEISEKFSGRSSSHASVESQMTESAALEAEGSTPEKSAKKKRKKIKVEE